MKKIIALLIALAVFSTTSVFAQQTKTSTVLAGNTRLEISNAINTLDALLIYKTNQESDNDLFDSIQSTKLTKEETQAVKGEGIGGAIGGAIIVGGFGGIIGSVAGYIAGGQEGAKTGVKVGASIGAVVGGIVGGIGTALF